MKRLLLLFPLALAGCASTRIVSQDPNAEIYLGENLVGIGEARVGRVGPPHRVMVEARKGGRTLGKYEMRRSFTFMTVVWGVCSYYTGFYWGWYYPESVTIPVLAAAQPSPPLKSPWAHPGESVWMQPLK